MRNELNAIKEFGALIYLSSEEIIRVIYWLIEYHYMIKTVGQYPVLHITSEGLNYSKQFTPEMAENLLKCLNAEDTEQLISKQDI